MIARAFVAVALALTLIPAAPLDAQQGPRRTMPRPEMERRIREQFAEVVRAQLGLSEDQQRRLGEVVSDFQSRRQALVRREMELRRGLGGTPLGSRRSVPLLPEEEAARILREMVALQEEEARLLRAEQEALLGVLPPPQLVRFYGMREQLAERIRRLQQGMRGR